MKKTFSLLLLLPISLVLLIQACDNSESDGNQIDYVSIDARAPLADLEETGAPPIDTGNNPTRRTRPEPADFGMVVAEKNSSLNEDVYTIYFNQFIPEGCSEATPCPSLILVPDKDASGDAFFGEETPRWIAAKTGAIVATYNPPGRGEGGRISTGQEDYNGPLGQDALSDVANFMLKNTSTTDEIGIISFGYGLVAASGALSRFKSSKLKDVDFLIDIEGPINRCWVTSSPLNPQEGIEEDGPGINDGRCDFDIAGRMDAFPVNLPANAPPALICSEQAFPQKQGGTTCEDDAWWIEREASLFLESIDTNYLRIQMLYDHRQASRWSSLQAIKYVVSSSAKKHYLNSEAPNQALHVNGDQACLENGCYLDFTSNGLGNSLRFPDCFEGNCVEKENPYAAAFEGFQSMSIEELSQYVLPQYVEQLLAKE